MKTKLGALAIGGCLFAACFFPADRGRALEARVDRLQSENAQLSASLQTANEKLAQTLPRVDDKIAEVSRALEALDRSAHRSGADLGIQLQKTTEDVAELRGQVEGYLHRIAELEAGLKRLADDTNKKLVELQGAEAVRAAEAKRRAEELARPADKKEFLALAQQKAASGDQALARQLFIEFVRKWPTDLLAGDAYFGLGETYFGEKKYREALAEYGKVIQQFPKAKQAPEAYLRSANCFEMLGLNADGKLALEELVKSYPKSEAAKAAKARLAQMNRSAKKAPGKKGAK